MHGTISIATLKRFLDAFNAHDLDAIMEFFSDDCELLMPRGKEPWGTRYLGKPAVREGLATRFAGIPDVHYGEDSHWVRRRPWRLQLVAHRHDQFGRADPCPWRRPSGVS